MTRGEGEGHALARPQLSPDVYVWCKCGARFDAYGNKGAMNKLQDHLLEELVRPTP